MPGDQVEDRCAEDARDEDEATVGHGPGSTVQGFTGQRFMVSQRFSGWAVLMVNGRPPARRGPGCAGDQAEQALALAMKS